MVFPVPRIICLVLLPAFFLSALAGAASPANAADSVAQGDALLKTRNYSEALAAYDQAISQNSSNFAAWNGRADALNRAGQYTAALAASDTALALEPENTRGWINRGYILYNLGRYDDELKAYETAISIDPGNADAWFNKGYALAGMKRYDEAIAAFDRTETLRPDYPNLAANRRIAVQLRDASTPVYVRYAPELAGVLVLLVAAGGFLLYRHTTRTVPDNSGTENRRSRTKRERRS